MCVKDLREAAKLRYRQSSLSGGQIPSFLHTSPMPTSRLYFSIWKTGSQPLYKMFPLTCSRLDRGRGGEPSSGEPCVCVCVCLGMGYAQNGLGWVGYTRPKWRWGLLCRLAVMEPRSGTAPSPRDCSWCSGSRASPSTSPLLTPRCRPPSVPLNTLCAHT